MTLFFNILLVASFIFASAISVQYFVHMFQLNSYKMKVQIVWLKKNFFKSVLLRLISSAVVLASILLLEDSAGKITASVIFLIVGFFTLPKKAKKPLVYTMRVIRLLITVFILTSVTVFCSIVFNFMLLLPVYYLFLPLLILIANIINRPAELAVNRYYINDAKKIIKSMPDLKVIGVTGSYGKTSVKFYLNKLLSAKYNVLMTPESYNTTLGVVKTVRNSLRATHEIFICEMGAKDVGHIKEICDIVEPDYGIITSIGSQHLESFKTIDRVVQGKFELADAVPDDKGAVFLNYDNEYIRNRKVGKKTVTYGLISENAPEYLASDIKTSKNGSEFSVVKDGIKTVFNTKLIGKNNVQNIIGAISVANTLGVSMNDLQIQVRRLESVPHRLQLIKGNNCLIIDDAYNSNPTGAKSALDTLAEFEGMKILVTPGMIELGKVQDECNREFGKQASEICDFVILVGKEQTRSIFEGLETAGYDKERIYIASDLQDALSKADSLKSAGSEKVVLLENDLPDNY